MESQISDLKTEFITIINNRDSITKIFDILEGRIKKLKLMYNEFISKNEKQIFTNFDAYIIGCIINVC